MNAPPGSYYVAVRHRNHLGIMTAAAVSLSAAPLSIDFTSAATSTYGTEARKDISGTQVMWMGNTNFNAQLSYVGDPNDRDPILARIGGTVPSNTVSGYFIKRMPTWMAPCATCGRSNDRDPILVNVGGTVPTNAEAAP